ncbi:MAG: hypothetical protein AAF393_08455 [Pseudomonadota bacterium]
MDENLKSFEKRLQRVDPDFKPTAWRRWRTRARRKTVIPMRGTAYTIVFAYVALTAVKVVMHQDLGAEGYATRVASMAQGDETSRIAAKLMFRDPVMNYVTEKLTS